MKHNILTYKTGFKTLFLPGRSLSIELLSNDGWPFDQYMLLRNLPLPVLTFFLKPSINRLHGLRGIFLSLLSMSTSEWVLVNTNSYTKICVMTWHKYTISGITSTNCILQ